MRREKSWNDHNRLRAVCTKLCLTQMMLRRSIEHQPLHLSSQLVAHIKMDEGS